MKKKKFNFNLAKNILTVIGVIGLVLSIGLYWFTNNTLETSKASGIDVLVAKTFIPEGKVIKTIQEANELFSAKRVAKNDLVQDAISVKSVRDQEAEDGLMSKVKNMLVPTHLKLTNEELQKLVGRKLTTSVYANQQIILPYLVKDDTEFGVGDRYFAVPVTYVGAVGGEIQKGDYVDLWAYRQISRESLFLPELFLAAMKVESVKDSKNKDIDENSEEVPSVVIFKMNEEQIALVAERMQNGYVFLSKYGVNPTRFPEIMDKINTEKLEIPTTNKDILEENMGGSPYEVNLDRNPDVIPVKNDEETESNSESNND